uniref:Uncharacterized protein n=1 Tax=Globisporangium ultimum (strain ATCC 200006 / CBS 805.95 / DAOM BR144) TaxID=431595 RepID=K3X9F5_GLOUD
MPPQNDDPVMKCNVTHVNSGQVRYLGGFFNAPVLTGAIQLEYTFSNWTSTNSGNTLNFTFEIFVIEGMEFATALDLAYEGDIVYGVNRYHLSEKVFLDIPTIAFDEYGGQYTIPTMINNVGDHYVITIRLPPLDFIRYVFAITPTSSLAYTPDPSPYTPSYSPTPTPSAVVPKPSSAMNVFPGGFEFCAASNCNIHDGSLSVMLDRFSIGVEHNGSNILSNQTTLTDFSAPANQLTFVALQSANSKSTNKVKSLFLNFPISGGPASSLSEANFADGKTNNATEPVVFMNVTLEHFYEPGAFSAAFEMFDIPKGVVKMSVGLTLPTMPEVAGSLVSLADVSLSFFISAFQNGRMMSNITATESDVYVTRIFFGDMYLEFPLYAEIDGYPSSNQIYVIPTVHASGEYEGLIQISLLVSEISSSFAIESIASSPGVDSGRQATPPPLSDGPAAETKMLTLAHGEFGLCFNPNTCDSDARKIGFSGLGSTESVSLKRFQNAAAFQFSAPQLVVDGGVEKWSASFRAFVPQHEFRPPMPYDEVTAVTSTQPVFAAQVDQYLTSGSASNGGQLVHVPSGSLKFSINITKWAFVSPTDTLVLNFTLSDVNELAVLGPGVLGGPEAQAAGNLSRLWFDGDRFMDIPLLAVLDGELKPIDMAVSYDPSVGITFQMSFPYFHDSLYYDPVMSTEELESNSININKRKKHEKESSSRYTVIAIILLSFLAFVVVVSVMRCVKRVSVKIDFSKIIP